MDPARQWRTGAPTINGGRQATITLSPNVSEKTEQQRPLLSIIIPTFNEEESIRRTLAAVADVQGTVEVIVADGGSDDATIEIARKNHARVITSQRGRGIQMHTGASLARGHALLFLHADTILPSEAVDHILNALARDQQVVGGNFTIRFDGPSHPARLMTWLYPKLEKVGLCYGDSGIFVRTSTYSKMGGFKPLPIFEDVDFVRRMKKLGRMVHLPVAVVTSSRRFEGRRFAPTFARWSILQALYWIGIPPRLLGQLYAPGRSGRLKTSKRFQEADRSRP
jgi:rSAM/selenodomain-associated transferase 2